MLKKKNVIFFMLCALSLFYSYKIKARSFPNTSLNPTQYFSYKKNLAWDNVFSGVNFAQGIILDQTSLSSLGNAIPIQKQVNMYNNSTLELTHDLKFDPNCTLSPFGNAYIHGNKNSLLLKANQLLRDLTLTATNISNSIEILSDTIIDGGGKEFSIEENFQLIVDSFTTLTLKNMVLKSPKTAPSLEFIKTYENSKLCLQNIILELGGNFEFKNGNLFIHDDVIIHGTSEFIYSSTSPCYITQDSVLMFDLDTVLTYSPYSDNRDLIVMKDESSTLYLRGCTVLTTPTAMRLTTGKLVVDDVVTFSLLYPNSVAQPDTLMTSATTFTDNRTKDTGSYSGSNIYALAVRPDEKNIIVGGNSATDKLTNYIYRNLNVVDNVATDYGGDKINTIAWSENSQNIIAAGSNSGGNEIYRYLIERPQLELEIVDLYAASGTIPYGTNNTVYASAFNPDSDHWVVGGDYTNNEIRLYNQGAFTSFQNYGGTQVNALVFSPDGNYLFAGGDASSQEVIVYDVNSDFSLTGSISTANYTGSSVYSIDITKDQKLVAIAGNNPAIELYSFDIYDGSLTLDDSVTYSGSYVNALSFSPNGKLLAAGGNNGVAIYSIDDGSLTLRATLSSLSSIIYDLKISPDSMKVFVVGNNSKLEQIPLPMEYQFSSNSYETYNWQSYTPSFPLSIYDNAITFGNSELGINYNLNVNILNGARLLLSVPLNVDNTK